MVALNKPLPSSLGPLFQNEGRCSAFNVGIIFHSYANNTHFHKKCCAPSLILKVRVFGTRKWPVHSSSLFPCNILYYIIAIIFVLFCVIELIEKDPKEIEEEVEATRIDLAKRNMQIQSLQYDLYKLQEKYDNDVHALKKGVEWGREKVGSLKLEIRRLKEHEPEDTISLIR